MQKNSVLNFWTPLACAALLWLAQPAMAAEPVVAGLSAERLERLDALLEREIGAGRLSGMVVAVARHGEVVQRTYGYMNLETREKMRDDALFRLYSMTKPVASVALLTLYEQGLFHLTDPLDKYIPQFAKGTRAASRFSKRPSANPPSRTPSGTRWGCRAAWATPMSTRCTAKWGSACSSSSR
jgi:CubicO group peptidase (beta-lactamase class C family)